ncbi:MAG: AAA family ATPase [Bacteroidales bacterium]|jgi:predicted AAA+ superfamily ATPase|nr:AAA family ATPase [Bacteroidales bacterium]
MKELFDLFYKQLQRIDLSFQRYLLNEINWQSRLIAITGARGVGKTTLLLQHIKQQFGLTPTDVLYVSLDNLWFSGNRLFDLVTDFEQQGGKWLFLDEVHKYSNWSQEIKNIYDIFPDLKVVITGSSILEIYRGNVDLSRRAVLYQLYGMSFREFLALEKKINFPAMSLNDILSNHISIAAEINGKTKPLSHFKCYLQHGCYPYYKEDKQFFHSKLNNTVNLILENDLPAVENLEMYSIRKIKKLLWFIAKKVPFTPNITDLANEVGVSRNSLLNFLTLLERAGLVNLLTDNSKGLNVLAKPEKIYLNDSNLVFAFEPNKPNIGNIRETFFFNQLKVKNQVNYTKQTDFVINGDYFFEIGGKNKGHEQLTGLQNAFLALDDLEYGFGNKIPLWLFGMMY